MHSQLLILTALSLAGSVYFVFGRKVFDFVSIGFFGQLIYFSPGFYGYVANPYFPGILPSVPIADVTYYVWNICLAATFATGIFYRPAATPIKALQTSRFFDFAILGVLVLAGALTFYTGGDEILSSDKNEVLDNIDRVFLLFSSTCQVATICFVIQRKWAYAAIPALGMAFLLYAGFRGEFALSIIAIVAYIARRFGVMVFFRPRYLIPALLAAVVLLGYKPFLTAYRLGNWQVLDSLQMSDNLFDTLILQFEPFLTQAVLNEVLIRNFQVPSFTLVYALVAFVPFLAPILGLTPEDVAFNFQDFIFPNIPYGITAAPETQLIAALGWSGLAVYVVAVNLVLVAVSRGLTSRSPARLLATLSLGAFFAFYLQRNDIANSLTLVNRVLVTVFIAWLASWMISAGGAEPRPNDTSPEAEPQPG